MKRITIIVLSAVTFLLALGLTIYPVVSIYVNQKYASEIFFTYEEAVEQTDDLTLAQARLDALRYNESILPGTLTEEEAFSQEALEQAAGEYDHLLNIAGNGIMGYVEIPVISVNLPIYHGTGTDSLERGVGHLLGSSLPVGGESTHAVLTGHSGMATSKMFTDLEQLKYKSRERITGEEKRNTAASMEYCRCHDPDSDGSLSAPVIPAFGLLLVFPGLYHCGSD